MSAQPSNGGNQGKRWVATLYNNYANSITRLDELYDAGKVRKYVCQEEQCPRTGRLHLQLFLVLDKRLRRGQLQRLLDQNDGHFEIAGGSDKQNRDYCTKAESATGEHRCERGDFAEASQGKRSDLQRVAELVRGGHSLAEIASQETASYIKYHKGIKDAISVIPRNPRKFLQVVVLYGPSGVGKSRFVREFAKRNELSVFSKDTGVNNIWFDGYTHQDVLLLDDFEPKDVPFRNLLKWMDVYELNVQVKGGYVCANWSYVFVTTNVHPDLWYVEQDQMSRDALQRRIKWRLQCDSGSFATEQHNEFFNDPQAGAAEIFGQDENKEEEDA